MLTEIHENALPFELVNFVLKDGAVLTPKSRPIITNFYYREFSGDLLIAIQIPQEACGLAMSSLFRHTDNFRTVTLKSGVEEFILAEPCTLGAGVLEPGLWDVSVRGVMPKAGKHQNLKASPVKSYIEEAVKYSSMLAQPVNNIELLEIAKMLQREAHHVSG